MNHQIRTIAMLLSALSVGNLTAQSEGGGMRYRILKGWSASSGDYLDEQLASFEKELKAGAFDPQAEKLLNAAEAYTKNILNVPGMKLEKAITRRDDGDVIVAEWKVDEPFGAGSLYLKDTPYISFYEMRLSGCGIQSRADLSAFLSKLIVWDKPPLRLQPTLEVQIAEDEPVIKRFSIRVLFGSFEFLHDFHVDAILRNGEWLIAVKVGKSFTAGLYPVPPFVPERFPPLTELVKSWSFGRIWDEVGGNYSRRGDLSEYRDNVLVAELVQRGMTDDQIVELLRNTPPPNLEWRAGVVLQALEEAGKQKFIRNSFAAALEVYERAGPSAARAAERLFRAAAESCPPAVEGHALRILKTGLFPDGPLIYLGRCAASEETALALDRLSWPRDAMFPKEYVLEKIRKRLAAPNKVER